MAELPTDRFKHNPLKVRSEINITFDLSVNDDNKLNQLREK
jgi:hypothetical protein